MKEDKHDKDIHDDFEPEAQEPIFDEELGDVEAGIAQKMQSLRKKLKQCEQEKMEHLENLQRAKADFLNARKRLDEERVRDRQRASDEHIEKLLPLCDSFHMAMSNHDAWNAVDQTWRIGMESIYNQLLSVLASYGVSKLEAAGADFDPTLHEAMKNVPVDSPELHHKVIDVIQNGYTRGLNGTVTLIRPARVTVGEYNG